MKHTQKIKHDVFYDLDSFTYFSGVKKQSCGSIYLGFMAYQPLQVI